jgi:hypothetical protein
MRTKTLLLTAALGAAGIATSMAQVYSVNAVGYVNKTIQTGFNLVANPLIQTNTTLNALIPAPPEDTTVYKFTPGSGFAIKQFTGGVWDPDGDLTIDLGGGVWINNLSGAPFTLTYVGEVAQGTLSTPVVAGFSILSSKVPQAGLLQGALGFTPAENDSVYQYANNGVTQGFVINQFTGGIWDPAEPNVGVAEAFWVNSEAGHGWVRTFTVN